jgi:hypothetical protein
MNENLKILVSKLEHLDRMKRDLEYSISKMKAPLEKIQSGNVEALTDDERETISAFNSRFSSYQEQIGKAFKSIAIEEEVTSESFTSILALMEKLGIIDDIPQWGVVRQLRNAANHVYEDDADELFQALNNMIRNAPYLFHIHEQMRTFVQETYIEKAQLVKKPGSTPGIS